MSRRPCIPSYRLHKATRQAIVTLGGTMFYLGVYGSSESREEYDRKIAEWLWINQEQTAAELLTLLQLPKNFSRCLKSRRLKRT